MRSWPKLLGGHTKRCGLFCIRKRWRRTPGNDGKVRVHVPTDVLETLRHGAVVRRAHTLLNTECSPSAQANDPDAMSGDARALITLLETRVAELQGRITELGAEVKEARAVNVGLTSKNTELTAKAGRVDVLEALLDAERRRGDELRTERDRLASRDHRPAPRWFAHATAALDRLGLALSQSTGHALLPRGSDLPASFGKGT